MKKEDIHFILLYHFFLYLSNNYEIGSGIPPTSCQIPPTSGCLVVWLDWNPHKGHVGVARGVCYLTSSRPSDRRGVEVKEAWSSHKHVHPHLSLSGHLGKDQVAKNSSQQE